jgi:excinuclease ABC subunit C
VNTNLEDKLKTLPRSSGVYFHKDKSGEIIYVGKAAVLKNRVKQYFQSTRDMDVKTRALVAEIDDTDWIETESEIDALFLESEMVKRYMPRFNILLRDDKSQLFVRIDMKSEWPHVAFTRNPADDGADYYGPYYNGFAVKKALRYLRKIFPYYTSAPKHSGRPDLDVHIGLSPRPGTTSDEYKTSLRKLVRYIEGGRKALAKEIEKEMQLAAKLHDFEQAANLRNKLRDLRELQSRIMFGDKEFMDISKDKALSDLTDLLGLKKIPARIEGYDISHMSGTNVVASMVVFSNGVSDRANYRKFKTKIEHNNDFYNMNETLIRRLSEKNLKSWGVPDLILIDGGKGQLDAALQARDSFLDPTPKAYDAKNHLQGQALQKGNDDNSPQLQGLALQRSNIPFIGLAKREEQIVVHHEKSHVTINKDKLAELEGYTTVTDDFTLINLPHSTHIVKLLQRIRDESHRFAVSYHSVLKRAKQTASSLDDIPGIGPVTRRMLIKKFGSLRGVRAASTQELIDTIGQSKTMRILPYLQTL